MPLIDLPEDMSELISFQKQSDIYNISFMPSIDSTNDAAKEIAQSRRSTPISRMSTPISRGSGAADGVVIIADSQTMGRGRSDHRWFSPKGVNIYMSAIFNLNIDISEPLINALNISVTDAICSSISKTSGLQAYTMRPNDIYFGNRKLGGALIESVVCGGAIRYIVVGIGINVNIEKNGFPPDIAGRATSILIETGRILRRGSLMRALLIELKHCISNIGL
jgi:BirA family biotin operon repressor/biotin-[acetyl-CoA-carboxylase] ligase